MLIIRLTFLIVIQSLIFWEAIHIAVYILVFDPAYIRCASFFNMNSSPTGPRNTPTGATSLHVLLACDLAVVGSLAGLCLVMSK